MKYRYIVRTDKSSTDKTFVYGINVVKNGVVIKSALGLFSCEKAAADFAEVCNRLELDVIHFDDVVLDLLKERELCVVM